MNEENVFQKLVEERIDVLSCGLSSYQSLSLLISNG